MENMIAVGRSGATVGIPWNGLPAWLELAVDPGL
jgi:hypothetical protein